MKWFNEYGWLLKPLPQDAIEGCSHRGACDADVEYWQKKLEFMAPRNQMIEYLKPFGAWTEEELNIKTDIDLAQTILWIAAGECSDNGEWFGLVH